MFSLAIFVAICGFVGIQSWPFLAAVFAFSLMKAADLPLTLVEVDRQMVRFEQVRTNLETFRDLLKM